MVSQVVEHHWVAGVNGVGSGEELHSILDGICLLVIELQNSQTNKSADTL